MGSRKNKGNRNPQNRPQGTAQGGANLKPTAATAQVSQADLVGGALDAINSEGIDIDAVETSAPHEVSPEDLRGASAMYAEATKAAKAREDAATKREAELEERDQELKMEKARLNEDKRAILEDKARNGNERADPERRITALETREKDLLEREAEDKRH